MSHISGNARQLPNLAPTGQKKWKTKHARGVAKPPLQTSTTPSKHTLFVKISQVKNQLKWWMLWNPKISSGNASKQKNKTPSLASKNAKDLASRRSVGILGEQTVGVGGFSLASLGSFTAMGFSFHLNLIVKKHTWPDLQWMDSVVIWDMHVSILRCQKKTTQPKFKIGLNHSPGDWTMMELWVLEAIVELDLELLGLFGCNDVTSLCLRLLRSPIAWQSE